MTTKFRRGDRVSLIGKVLFDGKDGEDGVFVDIDGYYATVLIKRDGLTLVAPRIDAGDFVRVRDGFTAMGEVGQVIGADGAWIWVRADGHKAPQVWAANAVEVLADKPEAEAA